MGPLGFLTGVVLGSAVSIALVLVMVLAVFLLSSADHPALLEEYSGLWRAALWFAALSLVAGVAFHALQRRLAWRWPAQALMWGTLLLIAWAYWPEPLT